MALERVRFGVAAAAAAVSNFLCLIKYLIAINLPLFVFKMFASNGGLCGKGVEPLFTQSMLLYALMFCTHFATDVDVCV